MANVFDPYGYRDRLKVVEDDLHMMYGRHFTPELKQLLGEWIDLKISISRQELENAIYRGAVGRGT